MTLAGSQHLGDETRVLGTPWALPLTSHRQPLMESCRDCWAMERFFLLSGANWQRLGATAPAPGITEHRSCSDQEVRNWAAPELPSPGCSFQGTRG